MSDTATLVLLPALAPYVNGIMESVNVPHDILLEGHSGWMNIGERGILPYLYKYIYRINTGTEVFALGSQYKIIFTTE